MHTSIKGMIQELAKPVAPSIAIGIVASVAPLRITLKNDLAINLSAVSVTIPSRLIPVVGKQYYLLAFDCGNSWYLLDEV